MQYLVASELVTIDAQGAVVSEVAEETADKMRRHPNWVWVEDVVEATPAAPIKKATKRKTTKRRFAKKAE